MFQIEETANDRWRIVASYEVYPTLPTDIATAILWRSYPTAQEAFKEAAEFYFRICDAAASQVTIGD